MILTRLLSKPVIAFYRVFLEIALWGALLASLAVWYYFSFWWCVALLLGALLSSGVLFVLLDIQRAVEAIERRLDSAPAPSSARTAGFEEGVPGRPAAG
ncbi:MAG TPA: hypothetical protein VE175_00475 [Woeseiaceae bacterium]|nr:hypothetical protein [Woeseiaceae bacterium]